MEEKRNEQTFEQVREFEIDENPRAYDQDDLQFKNYRDFAPQNSFSFHSKSGTLKIEPPDELDEEARQPYLKNVTPKHQTYRLVRCQVNELVISHDCTVILYQSVVDKITGSAPNRARIICFDDSDIKAAETISNLDIMVQGTGRISGDLKTLTNCTVMYTATTVWGANTALKDLNGCTIRATNGSLTVDNFVDVAKDCDIYVEGVSLTCTSFVKDAVDCDVEVRNVSGTYSDKFVSAFDTRVSVAQSSVSGSGTFIDAQESSVALMQTSMGGSITVANGGNLHLVESDSSVADITVTDADVISRKFTMAGHTTVTNGAFHVSNYTCRNLTLTDCDVVMRVGSAETVGINGRNTLIEKGALKSLTFAGHGITLQETKTQQGVDIDAVATRLEKLTTATDAKIKGTEATIANATIGAGFTCDTTSLRATELTVSASLTTSSKFVSITKASCADATLSGVDIALIETSAGSATVTAKYARLVSVSAGSATVNGGFGVLSNVSGTVSATGVFIAEGCGTLNCGSGIILHDKSSPAWGGRFKRGLFATADFDFIIASMLDITAGSDITVISGGTLLERATLITMNP